jgi:hypothetical protein
MRSNLVFTAGIQVANRFLLAAIAMRVSRKLHVNSDRTEQTVNHALTEIGKGRFIDAVFPEIVKAPAMEPPLIVPAA